MKLIKKFTIFLTNIIIVLLFALLKYRFIKF